MSALTRKDAAKTQMTAVQLLIKYLESENVKYVFGIPGGPLMPFYEALFEAGTIKPILAKHEEGAAFMADGYARVRRGLGVCCVTAGPGSTNALTGVAVSYADGIPVMLITGQVSTSAFGKGAIQEGSEFGLSIVDIFKPVTKESTMLVRADKMGETVRRLLRSAMSGRPGPVHLNLPADIAKTAIPYEETVTNLRTTVNQCFNREAVSEAAKYLLNARCPAILAGNGVNLSGAYTELRQFSEKYMIPVATTVKAKGAFPETHILSLGVFGFAGSPRAEAYLLSGNVDVLLTVGTSLDEDSTNGWDPNLKPREALLQIDVDPGAFGKNYPVKVQLMGDARTVLSELIAEMARESHWTGSRKRTATQFRDIKRMFHWCKNGEKMDSDAIPIKPQRLMRDLESVMPHDAMIFVDMGNSMSWAFHYLRINRPHSFFHSLGFASMGHAAAACIGAKLAAPSRPVISILGDAAFAMNGMEVHTACENNIPVIWIVMNNGGHGMVYNGEQALFGGKFHTGLYRIPLDIARIGEGLGANVSKISRAEEFTGALERALESNKPAILEVITDIEEVPPIGSRFKCLNKFYDEGNGGAPVAEQSLSPPKKSLE